jgi:hypothetical protein
MSNRRIETTQTQKLFKKQLSLQEEIKLRAGDASVKLNACTNAPSPPIKRTKEASLETQKIGESHSWFELCHVLTVIRGLMLLEGA